MGIVYPIVLPQSTLLGRASLGTGNAEAIPFASLPAIFNQSQNVKTTFGAVGDGVTDDSAALIAAAAGSASQSLIFPNGTYRVSNNVTFGATTTVVFQGGASLSIDSGKTVTINGPAIAFSGAIASGSGTLTLGSGAVLNVNSERLTNVGTPSATGDALSEGHAIGSTTANSGKFTTLAASGQATDSLLLVGNGTPQQNPSVGDSPHLFETVLDNLLTNQNWRMTVYGAPSAVGAQPNIHFVRARGTQVSPTAIQSGDILMAQGGRAAFDGSKTFSQTAADWSITATENWSATNQGTQMVWGITPITTALRVECMSLDGTGLHVWGGLDLSNNTALTNYGQILFPAAANLSANANTLDHYSEQTFTATGTGFSGSVTGTANYTVNGNIVVLEIPSLSGTSNATTFTITGAPAEIQPGTAKGPFFVGVQDNSGNTQVGTLSIATNGVITLKANASGAAFTGSGTKAMVGASVTFTLH